MAYLWSRLVIAPFIIVSTVAYWCISMLVSFSDPHHHKQNSISRLWARALLRITRSPVQIDGLEHIHPDGSYVFAANHASYMDTPVVLSSIPVQFRFLAKKGLFEIPFLGWYLNRAGHIAVPREDPRAALKTLAKAAETLQTLGISLLIFPEGGRTADGELQEFKDGAAYLAIKGQVPLVPVALIGTRRLLPMGSLTFLPGPVRLVIGEPIATEGLGMANRQAVTQTLRERIVAMLDRSPAPVV